MLLLAAIAVAVLWLPPTWGIAAVVAAGAVELAEIAVYVKWSKRRRPATGVEALAGRDATVVTACDPVGQVRVEGELWRARSDVPVAAGERVRVERVEGDLTLLVRPFAVDA